MTRITTTPTGVVPVVEIDDPGDAEPLVTALLAGGVSTVEITLRTDGALGAIRRVAAAPGVTVGAGTVLEPDQATAAAAAGARFIVSPGLDEAVVERARAVGLLAVPGVATASELQLARKVGLRLVKIFPAKQLGGPDFVAALSAPFPDMLFMPSGGVDPDSAAAYAKVRVVAALGSGWIAPRNLIRAHEFDEITRRCSIIRDLFEGGVRP